MKQDTLAWKLRYRFDTVISSGAIAEEEEAQPVFSLTPGLDKEYT
jgi:hypothetical protein